MWRAILLDNHFFWTRTDAHSEDCLRAFAERAGTLPLSLFISCKITGVPAMCDILASQCKRIQRLDVVVDDSDLEIPDALGDFEFAARAPLE